MRRQRSQATQKRDQALLTLILPIKTDHPLWGIDMTKIAPWGWLYLTVALDWCTKEIVGISLSTGMRIHIIFLKRIENPPSLTEGITPSRHHEKGQPVNTSSTTLIFALLKMRSTE